jgi:hypothetical protein
MLPGSMVERHGGCCVERAIARDKDLRLGDVEGRQIQSALQMQTPSAPRHARTNAAFRMFRHTHPDARTMGPPVRTHNTDTKSLTTLVALVLWSAMKPHTRAYATVAFSPCFVFCCCVCHDGGSRFVHGRLAGATGWAQGCVLCNKHRAVRHTRQASVLVGILL